MRRPRPSNPDWLPSDLADRLAGSEHAVVLAADGLVMARSKGTTREDAEHLAASASALHSLARSFGTSVAPTSAWDLLGGLGAPPAAGVRTCSVPGGQPSRCSCTSLRAAAFSTRLKCLVCGRISSRESTIPECRARAMLGGVA
ncbi:roadblock/LC7 domain-containing protein [Nocardia sp. NEAU-351]|uniref:Roadblock/LC7 domain-containing protein n=1 Tax=Nocardia bovistercoris TaxID=2785916 RepID=A0A931N2S0_9NOCA|nr:roadblock/LC7 domain-containing protein [Nocardia bovistercoris]